jgi:predicted PurR-regulated permease PerM
MAYKRLQVASFFLILLVVFIVVLLIIKPLATIVAFGIILAILFEPLHARFLKASGSPNLAALLTVILIVFIMLVPVVFFGNILFNEIVHIFDRVRAGDLVLHKDQIIEGVPVQLRDLIENFSRDFNSYLGRFTSNAFQSFSSLLSNVAGFLVSLVVLLFMLFYLLRDGSKIKQFLMDLTPIATAQENQLIDKIVLAVNGVVKGSFLTALSQGVVATVGFFIFGVPEPLLWGLFTVLAALVPTVGTSLALIPAVAYLVVTGHTGPAIGLAIWGAVAVGTIDNFLGPRLVGSRTQLHPLLVLLSVLGGIQLFGFLGFLIGPIIMAIFVALVGIYRSDFKTYVES